MHRTMPEPSCPITVLRIDVMVPVRNKPARTQSDHLAPAVPGIVLGNALGQDLAAPIQRVGPANAGRRDVYDLVDTQAGRRLEHLERAAYIQVEEVIGVLRAAGLVDAMPGGDVD